MGQNGLCNYYITISQSIVVLDILYYSILNSIVSVASKFCTMLVLAKAAAGVYIPPLKQ